MNKKRSLFYLIAIAGVLLLLFMISQEVDAAGSGPDYPYSGSGTWLIAGDTYVWDETIEIVAGDVDIAPTGNLYFQRNVTLRFISPSRRLVVHPLGGFYSYGGSTIDGDYPYYISVWEASIHLNYTTVKNQSMYIIGTNPVLFTLENSTFEAPQGEMPSYCGKAFSLHEADNCTIYNNIFDNLTNRFSLYECENISISYNDFISCENNFSTTNGTDIRYHLNNQEFWYVTVTALDTYRLPVLGADVVVYDKDETIIYDGQTSVDGTIDWIMVIEKDGEDDRNPHRVIVSKDGYFSEVDVTINRNMSVTVALWGFREKIQIPILMVNNYTKSKIEFGDLMCYLNQPADMALSDDYLCFDWENYVYYPEEYINVSIYDHYERLIWYQNVSANYSNDRVEFVAYINFTIIKIFQYDIETEEGGEWVHEWNLTLDDSDISVHFEGDEFGVPEVANGSNNYTLTWDETENYTAGSEGINNVTAETTYPPSTYEHKFTGWMVVDVGLQSKPTIIGSESFWMRWFGWIMPFLEGEGWVVISAMLAILGFVFLLHRSGILTDSAEELVEIAKKNQEKFEKGKISEKKFRKNKSNLEKRYEKREKRNHKKRRVTT